MLFITCMCDGFTHPMDLVLNPRYSFLRSHSGYRISESVRTYGTNTVNGYITTFGDEPVDRKAWYYRIYTRKDVPETLVYRVFTGILGYNYRRYMVLLFLVSAGNNIFNNNTFCARTPCDNFFTTSSMFFDTVSQKYHDR